MHSYLELAQKFYRTEISEENLPPQINKLPSLTPSLLEELTACADRITLSRPKHSWAIMKVACEAAKNQQTSTFLQALSAWQLARFGNQWGQPKRVECALSHAYPLFKNLRKHEWIAACDWQLNALPWTKPNFHQAAKTLENALDKLIHTELDEFVPYCRLDLAYAQMLTGQFDQAQKNIEASEKVFVSQADVLNQARCWFYSASLLQRQAKFTASYALLQKALTVFDNEKSLPDIAKIHYRIAQGQLLMTKDIDATKIQFKKAADLFASCELDLWWAGCINNLGAMYMREGALRKAREHYKKARERFAFHGTQGWLADNLNDSGKLNLLSGQPSQSIAQFKQAKELNEKLGSHSQAAIAMFNLGEAYRNIGQYQTALHYLESALEQFRKHKNIFRLATCEKFIAITWMDLGNPETALDHLDEAIKHYRAIDKEIELSLIYNTRARILAELGDHTEAIETFKKALRIAEASGVLPKAALAKRILGEAFANIEDPAQGLSYLEEAHSDFQKMQNPSEEAASLVALGFTHVQMDNHTNAEAAFIQSLNISAGDFPEVEWKAHSGLAQLAQEQRKNQEALQLYREGLKTLDKVRYDFRQPALAGSYLHKPAEMIQSAISFSLEEGAFLDTLRFIESSKATTFIQQFLANDQTKKNLDLSGIDDLVGEINWLRKQLKSSFEGKNWVERSRERSTLRTQFKKRSQEYDAMIAQLERRHFSTTKPSSEFSLDKFRELAKDQLGKSWIALDYYLTKDECLIVLITPDSLVVNQTPLSRRTLMALENIGKAKQNPEKLLTSDLDILGDLLLPQHVIDQCTPETHLLIAPHKELHHIPWAALQAGINAKPLACLCIPSVIPSFHSLTLLWERTAIREINTRKKGIVIGVSDFERRHQKLHHVKDEVAFLAKKYGHNSTILSEENGTWAKLLHQSRSEEAGLSQYSWLHIASHVFPDEITGRLSGIAFSGKDVWLDQLYELTPLPDLVTFSACNSIYNRVYEGDEHLGLPITSLLAGANKIIGSIWPVLDQAAAGFTKQFYERYSEEISPAQTLAVIQREAFQQGKDFTEWGSFIYLGVP